MKARGLYYAFRCRKFIAINKLINYVPDTVSRYHSYQYINQSEQLNNEYSELIKLPVAWLIVHLVFLMILLPFNCN